MRPSKDFRRYLLRRLRRIFRNVDEDIREIR